MVPEPVPRLDGWKAIADYLGRDVRTAQRWRDERGMPVHRVPGGRGGTVFADRGELDEWLFQTTISTGRSDATPPSDGHPRDRISTDRVASRRYAPRIAWSVAVTVTMIAVGVALKQVGTAQRKPAARLELTGNTLIARAADESPLWSFPLPVNRGSSIDGAIVADITLQATVLIPGQNDDGDSEIAAVVDFGKAVNARGAFLRSEVYWFRPSGTLRWTYIPHERLAFSGREFAGPWRVTSSAALPNTKTPLWISFNHAVWWPSFVVRLGPDGVPHRSFIHAGHIYALARVESAGGMHVIAGGVNNEYRAAVLTVLNEDDGPTSSPQTDGSPFACDDCASERPRRYFLLPRSELSAAFGEPYNYVDAITVPPRSDGLIEASVRESGDPWNLRSVYRFSTEFVPESVGLSDRYWEVHRELSKSGKLDHGVDDCPERSAGMVVRVWQPDAGWKNIRVPPTFATNPSTK
jgi:hypothetical protein